MDKIRILYFTPNFGSGGTERLVFDLCRNLDPASFEVSVCSFFSGVYSAELAMLGMRYHLLVDMETAAGGGSGPGAKFTGFLDRLKRLRRIIEEGRIDIVNTHHLGPFLHLMLLKPFLHRRIRVVHTEHNPPDDSIYKRTQVRICVPLLKYADAVTGVSHKVAAYLRGRCGVDAGKVHAILNGVNTDAFRNCGSRQRMREEMGFTESDRIIGMIGNLRSEKNQRVLVTAFSLLCGDDPRLHLVLAGDGPCRRELEQLARELAVSDRVRFLGHRLDAPEVMATFDVYCLPSIYEGMPLSILEAWSAGKPVVASDVTGIRDIVVHEVNGLLVPVNNPPALADGIRRVLDDPDLAERLCSEGQRYALEECAMKRMVGRYEELYRGLMTAGRNSG